MAKKLNIAVIGAGYAGLAAAVELAAAGECVTLFEASRTLGGRARAVTLDGRTVDNGAHLLVGAYRELQRLLHTVGADATALHRLPLRLEFPGHVRIAAPRLPAPLHLAWALLTARGLVLRDKLAALRFMRALQRCDFRLPRDISAKQLIANQPPRLRRFLWEPLCLAALNTPVAEASAQVFLNVLRDTLAADRAASDLWLPRVDYSQLFAEPAARFVAAHGGQVRRATRIVQLEKVGAGWTAHGHTEQYRGFDRIVAAVAPFHLRALLGGQAAAAAAVALLDAFRWQPIATVYLAYPPTVRLRFPMQGVIGGQAQWLFDRGALCDQAGLIAAVISGAGAWQTLSHAALAERVHGDVAGVLADLPRPLKHWVIEDKRGTFACTPNLQRPSAATADPTLWLAGDYIAGDYPATLEGAVRSGVGTARAILADRR